MKWITKKIDPTISRPTGEEYKCPRCGFTWGYGRTNHCPRCGAYLNDNQEKSCENCKHNYHGMCMRLSMCGYYYKPEEDFYCKYWRSEDDE